VLRFVVFGKKNNTIKKRAQNKAEIYVVALLRCEFILCFLYLMLHNELPFLLGALPGYGYTARWVG
jgi:hypothetical protein